MKKRNQSIRDGTKTLHRTVLGISETGPQGFVEAGLIRYDHKWWLVRKTKSLAWWKLVHPYRRVGLHRVSLTLLKSQASDTMNTALQPWQNTATL